ncbi:MAG: hypothetical protein Q9160_000254 [Pyrenula sp. 1 TL-2023]
MSLLGNVPSSLSELHALSDEIWYLAGDASVDTSWYTKRASLAAAYASSEMYMTTDTSKDFLATAEFLDRRLEDVQKVGSAMSGASQYLGFYAGNLDSMSYKVPSLTTRIKQIMGHADLRDTSECPDSVLHENNKVYR